MQVGMALLMGIDLPFFDSVPDSNIDLPIRMSKCVIKI